jgi:hypothetical protein
VVCEPVSTGPPSRCAHVNAAAGSKLQWVSRQTRRIAARSPPNHDLNRQGARSLTTRRRTPAPTPGVIRIVCRWVAKPSLSKSGRSRHAEDCLSNVRPARQRARRRL